MFSRHAFPSDSRLCGSILEAGRKGWYLVEPVPGMMLSGRLSKVVCDVVENGLWHRIVTVSGNMSNNDRNWELC